MNEKQEHTCLEAIIYDLPWDLLHNRWQIIAFTVCVAIVSTLYSFTLTRVYEGTSRFIAASRFLSSQVSIGILKGPTVMDQIVNRFGLMTTYNVTTPEQAREQLAHLIKFKIDQKSGIVSVSYETSDPQQAVELPNAFVEELLDVFKKLPPRQPESSSEPEFLLVIDKASLMEKPIGPKRIRLIMHCTAIAFLFGIFGTVLRAFVQKSWHRELLTEMASFTQKRKCK